MIFIAISNETAQDLTLPIQSPHALLHQIIIMRVSTSQLLVLLNNSLIRLLLYQSFAFNVSHPMRCRTDRRNDFASAAMKSTTQILYPIISFAHLLTKTFAVLSILWLISDMLLLFLRLILTCIMIMSDSRLHFSVESFWRNILWCLKNLQPFHRTVHHIHLLPGYAYVNVLRYHYHYFQKCLLAQKHFAKRNKCQFFRELLSILGIWCLEGI